MWFTTLLMKNSLYIASTKSFTLCSEKCSVPLNTLIWRRFEIRYLKKKKTNKNWKTIGKKSIVIENSLFFFVIKHNFLFWFLIFQMRSKSRLIIIIERKELQPSQFIPSSATSSETRFPTSEAHTKPRWQMRTTMMRMMMMMMVERTWNTTSAMVGNSTEQRFSAS